MVQEYQMEQNCNLKLIKKSYKKVLSIVISLTHLMDDSHDYQVQDK